MCSIQMDEENNVRVPGGAAILKTLETLRKIETLKKLYEGIFWVYTIIISLAIREVLVRILPRALDYFWSAGLTDPDLGRAPFALPRGALFIQSVRSIIFLVMTIRYHLGAVRVLEDLKENPLRERSWLHGLTGIVHFLLFYAWALAAFSCARPGPVSLFLRVLVAILFWSVVLWLCFRGRFRLWLYRNLRTLIYMAVLLLIFRGLGDLYAELAALIAVALVSLTELSEMFQGEDPPDTLWAFP